MQRRTIAHSFFAFLGSFLFWGCGAHNGTQSAESPPPASTHQAKSDSSAVVAAPATPVAKPDSTGVDPRPQVLVEGVPFAGVRTRLIPHVMGRGWALSVNKGDSIEFLRPADAALGQALFGLVPPAGTRILLRFRLSSVTGGIRIEAVSHLLTRTGPLPYRASGQVLAASLEDLRQDILTAPVSNGTEVDRVRPK